MGFLDDMKRKAENLAAAHEDKIDGAIDKAAEFADKRTGGKHAPKIEKAADKARDVVDKLATKGGDDDQPPRREP